MAENITFTEEQLRELCAEWQKRLRLQDWKVHVSVKRQHELDTNTNCAETYVRARNKDATVTICDPIDYHSPSAFPHDLEVSLVHELIHLHTDAFKPDCDDDDPRQVAHEAAIDCLAEALVNLARSTK